MADGESGFSTAARSRPRDTSAKRPWCLIRASFKPFTRAAVKVGGPEREGGREARGWGAVGTAVVSVRGPQVASPCLRNYSHLTGSFLEALFPTLGFKMLRTQLAPLCVYPPFLPGPRFLGFLLPPEAAPSGSKGGGSGPDACRCPRPWVTARPLG